MGNTVENVIHAHFGRRGVEDTLPFEFPKEPSQAPDASHAPESPELRSVVPFPTRATGHGTARLGAMEPERRKSARREAIIKKTVLLASGIAVGIALAFPLMNRFGTDQTTTKKTAAAAPPTAVALAPLKVTAANPKARDLLGDKDFERIAKEGAEAAPIPSEIIDFATNRPIPVAPRDYLYLKDSGRSFGPEYAAANGPATAEALKVTAPELARAPGDEGRFEPGSGSLQWQGGFRLENPEQNIKLGTAYQDYLKKTMGSGNFNNLSSFSEDTTSLLSQISKGRE